MANMFDENGNYNKTEWKPGDRITAGKLNKIEESLEAINNNDIERHKEADERLDVLEEQNEAVEERFDELEDLVADNKSEVDTAIYEVHSKMDRLEQEMNDGIDTVEAIAHTVDDKIAEADASMKAQVNNAKADIDTKVSQAEADIEDIVAQVNNAKNEIDTKVSQADASMKAQVNNAKADIDTKVSQAEADITSVANQAEADIASVVNQADFEIEQGLNNIKLYVDQEISKMDITDQLNYVTPQMYGAVADGEHDDTSAIQSALDSGESVYFPAGRYKVTSLLQVTNACKISMYKPYPCAYRGDYPITSDDNHMGCRIETYSTNGGIIIGDGVHIDGFYMRAMNTFQGVLFKYDGTLGQKTYPSRLKIKHVILDTNSIYTVPEAMFDFIPDGTYHHILEDITIGSLRGRQFCEYGFRSVMTTSDTNWANTVRIKNLCIDLLADYSLYIEGGPLGCANWVFDSPTIQTYPYIEGDETYIGKTGHIDIVTFKNMQDVLITGGIIWDLHAASYGRIFNIENSPKIATYCSNTFDQIDTYLSGKLQVAADNLNIESMEVTLTGDEATGGNYLTLSDGVTDKTVLIPGAILDDNQVNAGINYWFLNNAAPTEQIGRNKYNPDDPLTLEGYYYTGGPSVGMFVNEGNGMHTSNYIVAEVDDVIRISKNSQVMGAYYIHSFDENKAYIGSITANDSAAAKTINIEGTKYIRITWSRGYFEYADRHTANICVTVNDGDVSYVPYAIELVGGIGSYLVLQSPNGTQFTLKASDEGVISGKCVNGDVEPPVYATKSELNALRTEIGLEITETATLLGGDA